MASPAVRFEQVSKKFRRGQIHDSLRDAIASGLRRLTGRARVEPASTFWALHDVSFAVEPGEALGIIGPNGAGKSTALKLLARILRPDGGRVCVDGRLSALIEISAGLHGDLTGRENVYLSGAIMGMTRAEIRSKLDSIVAFAGLEDFMDTPVKRYSTGMTARLGFSVAAHVDPDVLLVDEVLSVGDIAFRQRCDARMREMVREGTTLVFVTHNLEQMRSICHRTAVLDEGRLTFLGDPAAAVEHYLRATMQRVGQFSFHDCPCDSGASADILGIRFLNANGVAVETVSSDEPVEIEVAFALMASVPRLSVEVTLRPISGEFFVNFNSARESRWFDAPAGRGKVSVHVPSLPLGAGQYLALVRMWDADQCKVVAETAARYTILIDDRGKPTGVLALPNRWSRRVVPLLNGSRTGEAAEPACVPATAQLGTRREWRRGRANLHPR